MATVTISFTMDDHEDRALLQWLECQPRRQKSVAIRKALHVYLSSHSVTLDEIYDAVRNVERKLDSKALFGTDTVVEDTTDLDEPPDAAAALANLGRKILDLEAVPDTLCPNHDCAGGWLSIWR